MANRCYIRVTCRSADRPRFEALGFQEAEDRDGVVPPPEGMVEMVDESGEPDLSPFPVDIPYFGWHGEGYDYGPHVFACAGEGRAPEEAEALFNGTRWPAVSLDPGSLEPATDDFGQAQRFADVLLRAHERLGIKIYERRRPRPPVLEIRDALRSVRDLIESTAGGRLPASETQDRLCRLGADIESAILLAESADLGVLPLVSAARRVMELIDNGYLREPGLEDMTLEQKRSSKQQSLYDQLGAALRGRSEPDLRGALEGVINLAECELQTLRGLVDSDEGKAEAERADAACTAARAALAAFGP